MFVDNRNHPHNSKDYAFPVNPCVDVRVLVGRGEQLEPKVEQDRRELDAKVEAYHGAEGRGQSVGHGQEESKVQTVLKHTRVIPQYVDLSAGDL